MGTSFLEAGIQISTLHPRWRSNSVRCTSVILALKQNKHIMRTIVVFLTCCTLVTAAPPHRRESKEPGSSGATKFAPMNEILPWEDVSKKDSDNSPFRNAVWSCTRTCNEITGDEAWALKVEFPNEFDSESAPYGNDEKTGRPLNKEDYQKGIKNRYTALYQWLLRRARRTNQEHIESVVVTAKWANGMELNVTGTQKAGLTKQVFSWKEPNPREKIEAASVREFSCAACLEKDRQIEKLKAALTKARESSQARRNLSADDGRRN